MRSRPWPIVLLAFLHVVAPVLNSLFSAYLEGSAVPSYLRYLIHESSWLALFDFFLALPIAGIAIFLCKRWSYFVVLAVSALNIFSNYQTYRAYPAYYPFWLFVFASIMILVLIGYLLIPAVKTVYMDPSIRWWESKPRYLVRADTSVSWGSGTARTWMTDISQGGLFLAYPGEIVPGSRVDIRLSLVERELELAGTIVYRREGDSPGYGIKFTLTREMKTRLKFALRELERRKCPMRTPFDWKKDFREWLTGFVHSGRGVIPELPERRRS